MTIQILSRVKKDFLL